MKIELYKAMNYKSLYESVKSKKMPFKTSYNFRKLAESSDKANEFYNAELTKLIEEYGEKDENGEYVLSDDKTAIQIQPERLQECQVRMNELSITEVDMPDVSFTFEELDGLEFSPDEVGMLIDLVNE